MTPYFCFRMLNYLLYKRLIVAVTNHRTLRVEPNFFVFVYFFSLLSNIVKVAYELKWCGTFEDNSQIHVK